MGERVSRERWRSRLAFVMAAVGSAVGLGNVWRFPYIAFKNGGGAFFIPYFVALITAGVPLMIVEYALGQRFQSGAPGAMAGLHRRFRWVGWLAVLVGAVITFYYVVIMAYAWRYMLASPKMRWTSPVKEALSEEDRGKRVILYQLWRTEEERQRLSEIESMRSPEKRLLIISQDELKALKQSEESEGVKYVSFEGNIANFFFYRCLGGYEEGRWREMRKTLSQYEQGKAPGEDYKRTRSELYGDMFSVTWELFLWSFVTWLAMFLVIFKGVRNVGRVVMITVPLPVLLLGVLLIRGITLNGSMEGLRYFFQPNWDVIRDPSVWLSAYGQVFFSLSLGFGILIAYASYLPPELDKSNNAFITSFANCSTSFLAGLTVFSVLGYLAYVTAQPVKDVVARGPGLVFITYPTALAKITGGWGHLAAFLFFLCLLSLGIDSAFSIVEAVVTALKDRFPGLVTWQAAGIFCAVGLLGSLPFCTRSGLMWLDIVDNWMGNYGLVLVGLLECIAVGYFYEIEKLREYINEGSEIRLDRWFDLFIRVVTPSVLIFLLCSQVIKDLGATYGGYDEVIPWSVSVAGWGVFAGILVLSMLLGRNYLQLSWIGGWIVTLLLWLLALGDKESAAMAALGTVLLFGGLVTCLAIALRNPKAQKP